MTESEPTQAERALARRLMEPMTMEDLTAFMALLRKGDDDAAADDDEQ